MAQTTVIFLLLRLSHYNKITREINTFYCVAFAVIHGSSQWTIYVMFDPNISANRVQQIQYITPATSDDDNNNIQKTSAVCFSDLIAECRDLKTSSVAASGPSDFLTIFAGLVVPIAIQGTRYCRHIAIGGYFVRYI